jgi:hypothetical protein
MAERRRNRKSRSLDYGRPAIYVETSIPEGWSYIVKDSGEDVFVNNTTQQEVCSHGDECPSIIYYFQKNQFPKSVFV